MVTGGSREISQVSSKGCSVGVKRSVISSDMMMSWELVCFCGLGWKRDCKLAEFGLAYVSRVCRCPRRIKYLFQISCRAGRQTDEGAEKR